MLFNLGLTADAAAAHDSDVLGPQSDLQTSSRHSSPPVSFATLPTWGLGSLYGRRKVTETEKPPLQEHPRAMSRPPAVDQILLSSDDEHSTVGPTLASSRIARSYSTRKQSSRPKTSYQLAHPASHARHRRLKLRPKLLLQLQQVSQTPRPLPILDVLPSSVFLPRLARKFPTIFRGKKGLGPNDLIVVTGDRYEQSQGDFADRHLSSDEENGEHREVVATICQLLTDDALSKGKAEICLSYGPVWEATPLANGSYEFVAQTDEGIQVLRWVLRGGKNRRVSAPPDFGLQEDSKRFTFSVINPNTRRHPVLATMTRNHLEVFHEYSIPATSGIASPTSAMSVVSDLSEMDEPLSGRMPVDDDLRMLIIVTSFWVAFREGWSHTFSYNDAASTLNPRSRCPSRQSSPTAFRAETDRSLEEEVSNPTGPAATNRRQHRMSTSSCMSSPPNTISDQSTLGRLSRRSNSTGAAFIERTNRRASGTLGRLNRHSTLSSTREPVQDADANATPTPARQDSSTRRRWSHRRKPEAPDLKQAPDKDIDRSQGTRSPRPQPQQPPPPQPDRANGNASPSNNKSIEPTPPKGKRRHRLSSLFDFIIRKSTHSH
ncbi:hypothetical protein ASPACDRAFT_39805 [Aspergillus aculeatus ATCC 16872]|uniref:Uncharacterized protein n=1 Tax=Aspergillus aculeatus (strain ATCC 16872 / CBS 172.66 / WB 5094) TaxID=690307 RepID=A0A1L9X7B0_ASPA1|nr:uncharacterized protein ASPACDRAFT_39805 [Aspergillus aculeatus ATCC 16872]OJK04188.1 hypothetical protein ASPACDRAFT_39805 [Aspergillus aculeatus ATCC 16872]